jgi:8-oxo-dGTP diphosphatase
VHQGGLWEFPGGKFENHETATQALSRELFEELNIKAESSSPLIKVSFDYPEVKVHLHVRTVDDFSGEVIGKEGQLFKWVSLQEINEYQFPEANKAILSAIKLSRHYAIINTSDVSQAIQELESVAGQGVGLVQIRAKELSKLGALIYIDEVREKCRALNLKYLFNSQVQANEMLDEGVHFSSSDLMALNERPETSGLVAASCHNLPELLKAERLGLDFVVLSPVKKTGSHPEAKALGWRKFAEWVACVNIPVFALGGMESQDYERAINLGAQGLSGISLYKRHSFNLYVKKLK